MTTLLYLGLCCFKLFPQDVLFCEGVEGFSQLSSQLHTAFSAQAAGNAVKRASDNLVKAAQKAAAFEDQENETVVVKEKMVGGIAQVSFAPDTLKDTASQAVTLLCRAQRPPTLMYTLAKLSPRSPSLRSLPHRKRCCGRNESWKRRGRSWHRSDSNSTSSCLQSFEMSTSAATSI